MADVLEVKIVKGRKRQWQRRFLRKWAVLIYGKGIILSPVLPYRPKRENSQSAYGDSVTDVICENIKEQYTNLLTSGKLNSYLADIYEQAEEMFSRLVEQLTEKENVTEKLKAENQIKRFVRGDFSRIIPLTITEIS